MLAFALRENGYYLRQDIIWNKPNPMPEPVRDRCTKAHEYIFLLSKSKRYYFDSEAIKVPAKTHENRPSGIVRSRTFAYRSKQNLYPEAYLINGQSPRSLSEKKENMEQMSDSDKISSPIPKVNKRSVWEVCTGSFKDAHFAVFPPKLIIDCIKAGCPENGIVLDPFMGAGTTAVVARELNRNFIGFEINEDYIRIAEERIRQSTISQD